MSDISEMIRTAALIRKATSYPAFNAQHEAHTSGMAELIAHLTHVIYKDVKQAIVDTADADDRTVAEASTALHEGGWRGMEGSTAP